MCKEQTPGLYRKLSLCRLTKSMNQKLICSHGKNYTIKYIVTTIKPCKINYNLSHDLYPHYLSLIDLGHPCNVS